MTVGKSKVLTSDAVVHKRVPLLSVVHETHKVTNVLDLADDKSKRYCWLLRGDKSQVLLSAPSCSSTAGRRAEKCPPGVVHRSIITHGGKTQTICMESVFIESALQTVEEY